MVSIWWLVAAFCVGGFAGVLLVALMHMAGDEPKQIDPRAKLDLDFMPTQW